MAEVAAEVEKEEQSVENFDVGVRTTSGVEPIEGEVRKSEDDGQQGSESNITGESELDYIEHKLDEFKSVFGEKKSVS